MKRDFAGANVMITGAASGLGRELAQVFYSIEGANLLLVDKNKRALKEVVRNLEALKTTRPQSVKSYPIDLSSEKNIRLLHDELRGVKIDILINNAGVFYNGQFENMDLSDFEKVLNIDLLAAIRLSRFFLPNIEKSTHRTLVNISSLAGLIGAPGMCAYSTAKFALIGFSQALGQEMRGRIHVCAICPSFVKTNMGANALGPRGSNALHEFIHKFGSNPSKAARMIVRAIKNRKALTLINSEAFFFYYLNKFAPGISGALINMAFQALKRRGIVAV